MNSTLKYWYLKDHRLFKTLSFSEIDSLCILKKFKKSKKNEIVDLPFSDKERIYLLKKGTLKLIEINDDGDEVLLDIINKGDLFGNLDLLHSQKENEFVKVVSDEAIICTFFRERLEEIMIKKPDFAINYIKFIGFTFKKIQNSYKNILFKDAKTRLLLFLNLIAEKEAPDSNNYIIPSYLTQKDIAQLICTTRQTVIALFRELEAENIISNSSNTLLITNIDEIKKIVENVK
jgi:CRP/FNR family transcriptional regulator, cyclic AMP receptor protein